MSTKDKLALLDSFYQQAVAAGMGAKFHCDGILLLSCFEDDGSQETQSDLEIPGADREEGRRGGDRSEQGAQHGASA
jgi:hypothetical protein